MHNSTLNKETTSRATATENEAVRPCGADVLPSHLSADELHSHLSADGFHRHPISRSASQPPVSEWASELRQ